MQRYRFLHAVLLVFVSSAFATTAIGQPENRKKAPPAPPELPPSAIYRVPKTKTTDQSGPQQPQPDAAPPETSEPRPQPQHGQQPSPRRTETARPSSERNTSSPKDDRHAQPGQPATQPVVTERVLHRKLGPEGLQQLLGQLDAMRTTAGTGKSSSSADVWFDVSHPRTGEDNGLRPAGTPVFQGRIAPSQNTEPVPVTSGSSRRATTEDARQTVTRFGSVPGGVVLEGVAAGLGEINDVSYDARFNALILNDAAAFFVKAPPKTLALICRAIAEDEKERLGVSLGSRQLIYGKHFEGGTDENSDLVWDLKLADHFLADIIFVYQGESHWTSNYKFANDFRPEHEHGKVAYDRAVFFKFTGFQFDINDEEIRPTRENFDVQLFPLSTTKAADGGLLPDESLIAKGELPAETEKNATHLAQNIAYYRHEKIVDRMFTYGEVASVVRALKRAGFDLAALANNIDGRR